VQTAPHSNFGIVLSELQDMTLIGKKMICAVRQQRLFDVRWIVWDGQTAVPSTSFARKFSANPAQDDRLSFQADLTYETPEVQKL
jgi:hypothetical protein